MLENLNKKQKMIVISVLALMVIVILFYLYKTLGTLNTSEFSEDDSTILEDIENEKNTLENNSAEDESNEILVHISGQVKNDMVVTLPEGSRIKDAIDAAGGLKKEADLTNINLAYILEDGEKIYIPKKGEEIEASVTTSSGLSETSSSANSSTSSKSSKININKATQTELETIPGVGSSTALKIINYRNENGKFSAIEDIKNVSGIGEAKYAKMKDYITVK